MSLTMERLAFFCTPMLTHSVFPTESWSAAMMSSYELGLNLFSLPFQNWRFTEIICKDGSELPLLLYTGPFVICPCHFYREVESFEFELAFLREP